jgi:hypothetical protein
MHSLMMYEFTGKTKVTVSSNLASPSQVQVLMKYRIIKLLFVDPG